MGKTQAPAPPDPVETSAAQTSTRVSTAINDPHTGQTYTIPTYDLRSTGFELMDAEPTGFEPTDSEPKKKKRVMGCPDATGLFEAIRRNGRVIAWGVLWAFVVWRFLMVFGGPSYG